MQNKLHDVDHPLNTNERYLYAMVMRLDALCDMVSSLMQHIADKEGVSTESVVSEVKKPRKKKVAE